MSQRGLRPQPKVAITLRCDEHLSFKPHQPRQFSTTSPALWPEGQSARALQSCGPVQCSSRRSVTATLRSCPHQVRTLVRTKLMHENTSYKSPPENLRGATRNQLLLVRIARMSHSVFIGAIREIRGKISFTLFPGLRPKPALGNSLSLSPECLHRKTPGIVSQLFATPVRRS